ncbi:peptidyl-tRNA hydrolase ICT1, mitochondrial-like [Pollicipes pollicipes]|uniref:peptidyl-tRNA hydrolase ICT1, mitochondrial-like n=1 Tax=Pollicipes pollicipes TaxID=41117 RepID=UPI001884BCC6|nr:peptidyl-tRNA hydrolase ICT1, mitochondrial-like [Pollicipes pollicipes]
MAAAMVAALRQLANRLNASYLRSVVPSAGFKSAYSLEKIYPDSDPNFTSSSQVPENEGSRFSGYIPMKDIDISYTKSSGPGGQNVNKLNTRVEIRFHVQTASWLPDEAKEGLLKKYRSRISRDGYLHVRRATRSYLVTDVLRKPKEPGPEAVERHRRLHEKATRERLREKRARSMNKRQGSLDV